MADGRHLEKSKKLYNTATVLPMSTKFRVVTHDALRIISAVKISNL